MSAPAPHLSIRSAASVLPLLLWAGLAAAHGGEDHAAPTPPAGTSAAMRLVETQTEGFEGVLKFNAAEVSEPLALRLFLTDFATNAPIEGAAVELSIPDLKLRLKGSASPQMPGLYEFALTPAVAGTYSAVGSVIAGERSDLLLFDGLVFGPNEVAPSKGRPLRSLLLWAGVLALVAVIFALGRWSRRSPTRAMGPLVGVLVWGLAASAVQAHGGEDHGEGGPKAAHVTTIAVVPKEAQLAFGIRTIVAAETRLPGRRSLRGSVLARPNGKAEIIAPEAGRITPAGAAMPQIGDAVRKGEALAIIEGLMSPQEKVASRGALVQAAAQRVAAAEELSVAERQWRRVEAVPEVFSQRERDEASSRFITARAADEAARRNEAVLRAAVDGGPASATRYVLTSPIDGVIASGIATAGEAVEAGAHLFVLLDPSSMWLRVDVPETDAGVLSLAKGSIASVLPRGDAGAPISARFVSASPSIDAATRSVAAFFETDASAGRLLEGQLVDVHVDTGTDVAGFVIPASAVVNVSGKTLVFVHVHAEEFAPRDVVLGLASGEEVEVLSGLKDGDRVVTSGAFQVRAALLSGT